MAEEKKDIGKMIPLKIKTRDNDLIEPGDLTPTGIFDTFNSNRNIEIQPLIDEIIVADPDIAGLMQTRKAVTHKIIFNYIPASEDQKDIDIADFIRENLEKVLTKENIKTLLDCNFKRFSVMELIWEIIDGKLQIEDIIELDRKGFEFAKDKKDRLLSYIKIYDAANDSYTDIPENKTIITYSDIKKYNVPVSLIRVISKYFIIKYFNITDWAAFNEIFGIPFRLGKYDPDTSSKTDIERLYYAVKNMGSDAAGVISKNDLIEILESKKEKPDTFKTLLEICDKKESVCILGQHNTTGVDAKGSYAALNILNMIKEDIIFSDLGILEAAINKYLIKPLVYFNFNVDKSPKVELSLPKKYTEKLEKDKKLKELGVKFNKDYFIKNYDINEDDFEITENEPNPYFPNNNFANSMIKRVNSNKNRIINSIKSLTSDKKTLDKTTGDLINKSKSVFDELYDNITKMISKSLDKENPEFPSKIKEIEWEDFQYIITKIILYSEYFGRLSANKDKTTKNSAEISAKKIINSAVEFSFDMPFKEALEYFQNMDIVSADQFYEDLRTYSGVAFTVSRITQEDTLAAIKDAIENQLSADEFDPAKLKETIQDIAAKRGETALTPFHLETIVQTNVQTSYSKGRYLQLTDSKMPFWQYFAIDDGQTTSLCLELNERVFRADDPFWDTYYPPNHFNCRSTVMGVDETTVEMEDLTVEQSGSPHTSHGVGEGFNQTPDKGLDKWIDKRCDELGIDKPESRDPVSQIEDELNG